MNNEIYRDEYNNGEKLALMMHFLAEMLTDRMQFNKCTLKDMEKGFINNLAVTQTSYKDDNYNISVLIITDKLKTKTTALKNFLAPDDDVYKIVISDQAVQSILNMFKSNDNWEHVNIYDIMSSRKNHITNPIYVQLTEEEQEQVRKEYKLSSNNLSGMDSNTDGMALYYNLKPGDIIRIIRPSTISGQGIQYRQCY